MYELKKILNHKVWNNKIEKPWYCNSHDAYYHYLVIAEHFQNKFIPCNLCSVVDSLVMYDMFPFGHGNELELKKLCFDCCHYLARYLYNHKINKFNEQDKLLEVQMKCGVCNKKGLTEAVFKHDRYFCQKCYINYYNWEKSIFEFSYCNEKEKLKCSLCCSNDRYYVYFTADKMIKGLNGLVCHNCVDSYYVNVVLNKGGKND